VKLRFRYEVLAKIQPREGKRFYHVLRNCMHWHRKGTADHWKNSTTCMNTGHTFSTCSVSYNKSLIRTLHCCWAEPPYIFIWNVNYRQKSQLLQWKTIRKYAFSISRPNTAADFSIWNYKRTRNSGRNLRLFYKYFSLYGVASNNYKLTFYNFPALCINSTCTYTHYVAFVRLYSQVSHRRHVYNC
jgi:hypothetical protein